MIEIKTEEQRNAFRAFANLYPHEASEMNWPEFVRMTREQCMAPNMTEERIRQVLKETE